MAYTRVSKSATTRVLLISCILIVDGEVVKDMLRVLVSEEQYQEFNQLLGRGVS